MNGRKLVKRFLSLLLALMMVVTLAPVSAEAEENSDTPSLDYRIVHLDCGRKYFSVDNIKSIIDTSSAAGFNYLELAVGNDGLRFLLDDMSLTVGEAAYESATVTGAVQAANKEYYDAGEKNELTQAEMDEIIAYANEKGMGVIPLLNTPGHMNAIVSAMGTLGINGSFNGSANTVDVTNSDAVAFTKALLQKYVTYFAEKGCTLFNFGADEYANDIYSTGGMGFAQLVNAGQYDEFVAYINDLATMIKDAGMIPMAFNDGIYYNRDTSNTIDTDIMVTYWSSGWSGYNVASASFLADQGFKMINTHGDYYWVLGKTDAQCSAEKAAGFDATAFMGSSTISNPAGAMFCIWCDVPGADTADSVVANTKDTIIAFGGALTGTGSGGDEGDTDTPVTVTDSATGISITANGLTGVSASKTETDVTVEGAKELAAYEIVPTTDAGNYTGSATVSIPVSETWTNVRGGVLASDSGEEVTGIEGTLSNGNFTFEVPHFSTVVVYDLGTNDLEERQITVTAGSTATDTIEGVNLSGNTYSADDPSIVSIEVTGNDGTEASTSYSKADVNYNDLIDTNSSSWQRTGYYYRVDDGNYYPLYAQRSGNYRYNYTWGYSTTDSSDNVTECGTDSDIWFPNFSSPSRITVYQVSGTTPETPASTTVTFTAASNAAGQTTYATVGNIHYTINVVEEDLSEIDPLTVEYWITNAPVTADGATNRTISAEDAYSEDGVAITDYAPLNGYRTADGPNRVTIYWQSRILNRTTDEQTGDNGDDETQSGSRITRVRYWDGQWQTFSDETGWNNIPSNYQLVAYYLMYAPLTDEVTVATKDWGFESGESWGYADSNDRAVISFQIVDESGTEIPADEAGLIDSSWIYYRDTNGNRQIGYISILTSYSEYDVYKVTYTMGSADTSNRNNATTINNLDYDVANDETTIYESENGLGSEINIDYTSGTPRWTESQNACLIRIYIQSRPSEDNLTVHFIDNATNQDFYNYPITVQEGELFDENFALDVDNQTLSNSTVINNVGNPVTVSCDLDTMPRIPAAYRNRDWNCVRVERSDDGKEVFLYYEFNETRHSVVYDYGLPITVSTTDLGITGEDAVEGIAVTDGQYGRVTINGDSFTYTPNTMSPRTEDLVLTITYAGSDNTQTAYVTMTPATSVYYEDDCGLITFSSGWGTTGTSVGASQAYNTTPYGNDSAYRNYTAYSNGSTHETTINKGEATQTATFTFTGTGFDIYSQTGKDNGLMSIRVVNDEGTTVKNISVQNTGNDTLYQIPVYTVKDLAHDTYTVTVTAFAANTNTAYPSLNRGGYHVIDAVQIYNPLTAEGTQYQTDKEANAVRLNIRDAIVGVQDYGDNGQGNGVLYMNANIIDGGSVIDYTLVGPNNEAYFKSTDSMIGFILETSEQVETLQIGAKSADGNPVTLKATVNGTETTTAISTNTAMNYVLNGGTPTQVDGKYQYNVYISKSAGTGILSITDVKATFAAAATAEFKYNEELVNALSASVDEPAETEAAIVENGVSIATSRVRYGRDMTMKVVTTGVLQEGQIFTVKAGNRTYTIDAKSSLYRLNVGDPVDNGDGTYTYTINLKPYAYSLRLKSTTFTVTLSGSEGTSTSGSASAVVRLL